MAQIAVTLEKDTTLVLHAVPVLKIFHAPSGGSREPTWAVSVPCVLSWRTWVFQENQIA